MDNQAFERFRKEQEQADQRRREEEARQTTEGASDFERGKLAGKEWAVGRATLQDLQGLRELQKGESVHRQQLLDLRMRQWGFKAEGPGFRAGLVEAALEVLDSYEAEKGKA